MFLPLTVLSALCISLCTALSPTGNYSQGPIVLSNMGTLWHRVDLSTRTAYLALFVNDSRALSLSAASWLGVGFSEPTSGSMLGGDVVTAEFTGDDLKKCKVTDRYVPFVPFPLLEPPGAFPIPDDCQEDGSWVLVNCERDFGSGEMLLEVSRPLDAHDTQDRDIVEGQNSVIFAYGGNFGYHGGNRGSTQVVLYETGVDPDEPIQAEPSLPDDVDGFMDVLATNYTVPDNKETIYACTSKVFELELGRDRMIIAAEHIIDSHINMVHHLTVFVCSGAGYANKIKTTTECTTADGANSVSGPLGNPESGCSTFIYAYAKGMGRFLVPREAGFRVKKDRPFVVMETHYDNPEDKVGNIDSSGVRLYYTDTMRDNDAGSLLIGDSVVARAPDVVRTDFEYEHSCPSECTERMDEKINIFGSFLHMHTTGREIYTNKFSKNGTYIETMNQVNFWSDSFQKYVFFDPPLSLSPGEQLQTTCVYDTSKKPGTIFGLETKDEMCMDFVGYWPLQVEVSTNTEINICSYGRQDNMTFTFCGDNANLSNNSVILSQNPKFSDTKGALTTFGDDVDTCSTPSSPVQPTSMPQPTRTSSPTATGAPTLSPVTTPVQSSGSPASSAAPPNEDDENTCFPADASVRLKDGSSKRMDELEIGDEVQVSREMFSEVFMFTHRDHHIMYSFVLLETREGISLQLTRGHYLYLNSKLSMADTAMVGDVLTLADGNSLAISNVSVLLSRGLFNPQTIHGDIVVNGVTTSTYTRSIAPNIAHGLLAPVRFAYRLFSVDNLRPYCSRAQ